VLSSIWGSEAGGARALQHSQGPVIAASQAPGTRDTRPRDPRSTRSRPGSSVRFRGGGWDAGGRRSDGIAAFVEREIRGPGSATPRRGAGSFALLASGPGARITGDCSRSKAARAGILAPVSR